MSRPDPRRRARALPIPRPGAPPQPRVPRPERIVLDNGLRLVAVPRAGLPQIVLKLVVPAGAIADPAGFPGAASLVSRLLAEGTERFSAEALNARLDGLGASLDVHVGHDFAEIELFLLSEALDEALPLFAELVLRPAFPAQETERVRQETLDALVARHDEPANVADDAAARAVFGDAHPYGRPTLGTESGVRRVAVETLRELHAAFFRPAGSVLVAAGELDVAYLARRLEAELRDWHGAPRPLARPPVPDPPAAAGRRIELAWPDAAQAEIRIAGTGLARISPDWIAAAVANYVLGGSTITSRLGANLREEKGWTYGARSAFSAGVQPGGWMADTAVDLEVRDAALGEMRAEIDRLLHEPVPAAELQRAKDALVLSLPRAFETPGRVVSRFATQEMYGLAEDYWERFPEAVAAVTAEDVQRMARRYFEPRRLVEVVVG